MSDQFGMPGGNAGDLLPPADRDIDVERVQLDQPSAAPGAFGCQNGRAGLGEWEAAIRSVATGVPEGGHNLPLDRSATVVPRHRDNRAFLTELPATQPDFSHARG